MYIVGTSGHIDHGKTSLIRALTGIDCDRLPEEKAREMTIDIGFASIEYPKFGRVSVIDVPGHERFIRNMVAGAWGIDLALLVVAVDDGWMPQTEDHFRVLSFLGVERLIAVLNKVDLADAEMIDFVAAEVVEKLASTRFAGADIVRVSSKTGQGIEELRATILKNIKKLPKAEDAQRPYLFIDRAFAGKGYGTVVTGTLKNGRFVEDEEATVLPLKKAARIKKIESHHEALQEGIPSQRTALNLAGVSVEELERGFAVVRHNFFTDSSEIIARIALLDRTREIKNTLGIEVLGGASSVKGRLILMDETAGEGFHARIRFDEPWFFYPGEPFILTLPGGFRILGGGTVLLPDFGAVRDRRLARRSLAALGSRSPQEITALIVELYRSLPFERLSGMLPQSEKSVERIVGALIEQKRVVRIDEFLLDAAFFEEARESIASAIARHVGLNIRELADRAGIDVELCRILLPALMEERGIIEKEGKFFTGDSITIETLSEEKHEALRDLLARGREGIEIDRLADERLRRNIKELVKLGFCVSLDGNIILHREVYRDLSRTVMALFDTRERISVPEAKDATGLSRKYILPLLNRIESDGLVRRVGDFRIKA